jgi:cell division protein ZapA (FtsZ GTPase activity inhibitor)
MPTETSDSLAVRICGEDLRLRVHPDDSDFYQEAAELVNKTWEKVRQKRVAELPQKTLAMTAFQLAADLIDARDAIAGARQGNKRLTNLIERIDHITEVSSND